MSSLLLKLSHGSNKNLLRWTTSAVNLNRRLQSRRTPLCPSQKSLFSLNSFQSKTDNFICCNITVPILCQHRNRRLYPPTPIIDKAEIASLVMDICGNYEKIDPSQVCKFKSYNIFHF